MKLLPVLDLMHGQVVRGIAGRRAAYRPIVSQIAADSRPVTVSQAFVSRFGCSEIYLADLDAIAGGPPDWATYVNLVETGVRLIVDAGVGSPATAQSVVDHEAQCMVAGHHPALTAIVVGLESVVESQLLAEICKILGDHRAVFSLDLKDGRPMTSVPNWHNSSPRKIAEDAVAAGFRRLIVLDVASVGTDQGPTTTSLCREVRKRYPDIELISGGGVRSTADVDLLLDAGCDRVLVASALHDGRISGQESGQWSVVRSQGKNT